MICTTLVCVRRPVSLDIWHVERCICVWSSWLSTSSSTAVTCSLQSVRASVCRSHAFGRCFLFPRILFSKVFSASFFRFFFENSVSILCEPCAFNWCKFLINALSSVLYSTLLYWCFVTVLKLLFTYNNNIVCFCLQTPEMYLKLNII